MDNVERFGVLAKEYLEILELHKDNLKAGFVQDGLRELKLIMEDLVKREWIDGEATFSSIQTEHLNLLIMLCNQSLDFNVFNELPAFIHRANSPFMGTEPQVSARAFYLAVEEIGRLRKLIEEGK
jgi:hypothetical protein